MVPGRGESRQRRATDQPDPPPWWLLGNGVPSDPMLKGEWQPWSSAGSQPPAGPRPGPGASPWSPRRGPWWPPPPLAWLLCRRWRLPSPRSPPLGCRLRPRQPATRRPARVRPRAWRDAGVRRDRSAGPDRGCRSCRGPVPGQSLQVDPQPPRSLDEQRHQLHCDVLRHLKVPITHRRLDSYMRPAFIEPASKADGTKVAGRWSVLDLYGLNMQLGLIKPPGH